ncbi:MAG: SusC/RagA family TonB-linked outer membrane protein, partial [Saprospiraceae bacterium]|nr:SusC/RagA family TonB-linked outer membrane protein [Saprospiraceae bacterium]
MKSEFTKSGALLAAFLLLSTTIMAQFTVSGTVTDVEGDPLIGVSVLVQGTTQGTATDINGNFSLQVPESPTTLLFSYTGYKSIQRQVTAQTPNLDIVMEDDIASLEEVVVTGLATSIQRRNLANSVASVPAKEISEIAVPTTTDAALYGKFKGVNITAASGAPGGGLAFRLRGLTSISGSSQPLIILDGVYIDNSSISAGLNVVSQAAGGGNQSNQDNPSNRLADIDPNDIETIEILKGPSAAAIYGSRASGGVVIISTKRGTQGRTKVSLSQSTGWTEMLNPQGVRQFTEEKVLNSGRFASSIDQFREAQASGNLRDYEDELYGNKGLLSNTRLTVSGGNQKTTFFLGGTVKDEEGIVNNTGFEKISGRINVDHKLSDWIDVSMSTNYIHTSADRGFFNNDNSGPTMGISFSATPSFAQLLPNESGIFPRNPFAPSNFLETAALVTNNEQVNRFIGGGTIRASLLTNDNNTLRLVFRGGVDYYNLKTTAIFPNSLQFQSMGNGLNGVSVQGVTNNLNSNISAFLVWSYFPERNISFRTQVGVTQEDFDRNTILGIASDLIGSNTNLDQSGTRNVTQNRLLQKDKGLFVQEEFNFRDKVIATVGLRIDKSSNNGDPNEKFFYPKGSLALNLHEFNFLNQSGLISQLKLRGAYGQSGNFAAFGSKFTTFPSAIVDGSAAIEIGTRLGNALVGPERQEEIEFGFDLGLFDNRAALDLTYYVRTVDDLLLNADVPTSSGFTSQVTNAAELENRGLEIGLNAEVLRLAKFNWNSRVSWWKNQAEVTELLVPSFTTGGFADFLGQFRIKEGR